MGGPAYMQIHQETPIYMVLHLFSIMQTISLKTLILLWMNKLMENWTFLTLY